MPERVCKMVEIDGGVVVGIDGSEASIHALHMATEEACCHDTVLHVICAWSVRAAPRPADCPPGAVPTLVEYEQEVLRRVRARVTEELGAEPPCKIELHAVHAPSAQALVDASQGADMLVVGHRGRGGFRDMVLGSVAEQCVRQAHCPVLIVRPRQ